MFGFMCLNIYIYIYVKYLKSSKLLTEKFNNLYHKLN